MGRDRELADAHRALGARARPGPAASRSSAARRGIGKTRLALELLGRARAAGARAGRAAPPPTSAAGRRSGRGSSCWRGLARELDPPPAEADWPEELAALAPSLPLRLGAPAGRAAEVPPDLARARLFEAAVELAEHATADRPLVLLFDDVHLADAPTLELLAYSRGGSQRLPVLLVLTRRTSRGATRSTRSPTPPAAAASRCASSSSSR